MLVLANVSRGPATVLHFILIFTKVARISLLLLLPFVYLRLRNDKKTYEAEDAESQPLFDSTGTSKQAKANGTKYGSTDAAAEDSGNESDDSWDERQKTAGDRMRARLDRDGSWWTYAKGFNVRPALDPSIDNVLT